jgi:uracil phosphoribosyltransferase
MGCAVIDHALVREKVGVLRDRGTGMEVFRRTLGELSVLVGYEALRGVAEAEVAVETPMAVCRGSRLAKPVVIVPILRAGLGMADALSAVLPGSRIGHIGVARNEATLEPEPYFLKLPPGAGDSTVLVVDPMLATGNSAVHALDRLKAAGCREVRLVCLIGAPEGVERVGEAHAEVPIFLAALDDGLDERGYIVPGLGDAGDRYFGT